MPYKNPDRQRAYQRERNARVRAGWLAKNGPCTRCGSSARLNVDHIDPDTKVSHNVWSWSQIKREAELAKCQVLCFECHKKKNAKEAWRRIKHGTRGGYDRGCRCDKCKLHQSKRMLAYHKKNGR